MIKNGYFIDKDGKKYLIKTDTWGIKYIEKGGRSFCI